MRSSFGTNFRVQPAICSLLTHTVNDYVLECWNRCFDRVSEVIQALQLYCSAIFHPSYLSIPTQNVKG